MRHHTNSYVFDYTIDPKWNKVYTAVQNGDTIQIDEYRIIITTRTKRLTGNNPPLRKESVAVVYRDVPDDEEDYTPQSFTVETAKTMFTITGIIEDVSPLDELNGLRTPVIMD